MTNEQKEILMKMQFNDFYKFVIEWINFNSRKMTSDESTALVEEFISILVKSSKHDYNNMKEQAMDMESALVISLMKKKTTPKDINFIISKINQHLGKTFFSWDWFIRRSQA